MFDSQQSVIFQLTRSAPSSTTVGGSRCTTCDTFYATTDICSHAYAELSEGYLDIDDCTIECPLHGSRFDIATGAVLTLPAYEPIATYPVRVEGEDVLVEL